MSGVSDSESGLSLTTWGRLEGRQVWKAYYWQGFDDAQREAYFTAPRDTDIVLLFAIADVLMGNALDDSALSLLENDNREHLHG